MNIPTSAPYEYWSRGRLPNDQTSYMIYIEVQRREFWASLEWVETGEPVSISTKDFMYWTPDGVINPPGEDGPDTAGLYRRFMSQFDR